MEVNKDHISAWLRELQGEICDALEKADGGGRFGNDPWTRAEGGGGITRIVTEGTVIEKGGVLFSAVEGIAPDFLVREIQHAPPGHKSSPGKFFATGVSIVIHPKSPMVPIIHMNVRYFEMYDESGKSTRWLGGGIDLTPHYIDADDARFFHAQLKNTCDRHHQEYYPRFKKWADDYFFIPHRNETRGIGGIFFDRLMESDDMTFEKNLAFWKDVGKSFAPLYTALISKNRNIPFGENHCRWQLLRRGRYVEFNLIYDKGTRFGLESNGRVESILMSLPKLAGWEYDYKPVKKSEEEKTLLLLVKGRDWLAPTS